MKRLIYILILLIVISCKGNENKNESGNVDSLKTNTSKTEYTCPMHPEVMSDVAGQCPQCGMDLEAKS